MIKPSCEEFFPHLHVCSLGLSNGMFITDLNVHWTIRLQSSNYGQIWNLWIMSFPKIYTTKMFAVVLFVLIALLWSVSPKMLLVYLLSLRYITGLWAYVGLCPRHTCTLTTCPIAFQYSSRVRWPVLYSRLSRWILASRFLHFRFRVGGASPLSTWMTASSKRPCSSFNFLMKCQREGCLGRPYEFHYFSQFG